MCGRVPTASMVSTTLSNQPCLRTATMAGKTNMLKTTAMASRMAKMAAKKPSG